LLKRSCREDPCSSVESHSYEASSVSDKRGLEEGKSVWFIGFADARFELPNPPAPLPRERPAAPLEDREPLPPALPRRLGGREGEVWVARPFIARGTLAKASSKKSDFA